MNMFHYGASLALVTDNTIQKVDTYDIFFRARTKNDVDYEISEFGEGSIREQHLSTTGNNGGLQIVRYNKPKTIIEYKNNIIFEGVGAYVKKYSGTFEGFDRLKGKFYDLHKRFYPSYHALNNNCRLVTRGAITEAGV